LGGTKNGGKEKNSLRQVFNTKEELLEVTAIEESKKLGVPGVIGSIGIIHKKIWGKGDQKLCDVRQ